MRWSGVSWDTGIGSRDPRRQALNLFTPIAIAGLQADVVTRNTCNVAMVERNRIKWCLYVWYMFQSWFFLSKSWKHGVVCFVFRREMDLIWLLDIFCRVFTWWRHRLHRIWFQYFLDSWHLSVIVPAWSLRYCSVSVAWSMENFRFNSPFRGQKSFGDLKIMGYLYHCALYGGLSRDNGPTLTPLRPGSFPGIDSWRTWSLKAQCLAKIPTTGWCSTGCCWCCSLVGTPWDGGRGRYLDVFVKDLKELKWPRFEMMNNCWKLCDLKTGDHVAILQLLSFGKCSCLKNTDFICQSRCFSPLNWDFASKTGMATKVCHNIPCCFSMCIFVAHLIWEANLSVFASPGIRSTLAMDTSSGTLLEVWMGWFFIGGWDLPTTSNERSTRSR